MSQEVVWDKITPQEPILYLQVHVSLDIRARLPSRAVPCKIIEARETDMIELMERMGPLGVPLLVCSVVSLAVIIERLFVYARFSYPHRPAVEGFLDAVAQAHWSRLDDALVHMEGPFAEGARLLLGNRHQPRGLREDMAAIWLAQWRRRQVANLRLLHLIAVLSPLLGLLGTVIGMIVAFRDIAAWDRPVNPAVVADGLWQAMLTTALGLSVALPALVAAHLFRIWAGRRTDRLVSDLDRLSLALECLRVPPLDETELP